MRAAGCALLGGQVVLEYKCSGPCFVCHALCRFSSSMLQKAAAQEEKKSAPSVRPGRQAAQVAQPGLHRRQQLLNQPAAAEAGKTSSTLPSAKRARNLMYTSRPQGHERDETHRGVPRLGAGGQRHALPVVPEWRPVLLLTLLQQEQQGQDVGCCAWHRQG